MAPTTECQEERLRDPSSAICWERDATGCFREAVDKGHGRIQQRSIQVLTPSSTIPTSPRSSASPANAPTRGITEPPTPLPKPPTGSPRSPPPARPPGNCSPTTEPLVEVNHHIRDTTFASPAPASPPKITRPPNLALALILHDSLRQHRLGDPSLRSPTLRRLRRLAVSLTAPTASRLDLSPPPNNCCTLPKRIASPVAFTRGVGSILPSSVG